MIRFLSACVIISFATTAWSQKQPAQPQKGMAVAKKGTPEVDAEIDEIWKTCPKYLVNQPIADLLQIESKDMATATVRVLWDDRFLYALWVVKDSELSADAGDDWAQDSVELFLDQHQDKSKSYEADDAQYRVNFKGKISGQGTGYDEADIKAATKKNKKGYIVEMAIRTHAADNKPGTVMGIEFQVNDDHGSSQRDAIAKWFHTEDDSWQDTSTFGTLTLK
ncbi:MAG: sugar-binding protein [Rubripirellula sp.]